MMNMRNNVGRLAPAGSTPVRSVYVAGNALHEPADAGLRWMKQGIWAYFFLLIFEGALRKWVFPGLAAPLLVVRDPIAVWLIVTAWRKGLLPFDLNLIGVSLVAVVSVFAAFYLGHGNISIAIFGARIFLVHFPLIFIIGKVFSYNDVLKMGKVALLISVPMAVLILLQFYSPQSAWINRGVGGDMRGAGFAGAMGYLRPPGTFSFTNGLTHFFSFVAAYVFFFLYQPRHINLLLLLAATFALLLAIPFSISRSLFFSVIVSFVFSILIMVQKPRLIGAAIVGIMAIVMLFVALQSHDGFREGMKVFTARFENASTIEGGVGGTLVDRYLGGFTTALMASSNQPFFGHGIGLGTNVGAMLLKGKKVFLISEEEWGRLIGEMGPLLGMLIIIFRLRLSWQLTIGSYRHLRKGNFLPWMLLSFALLNLPQGQWAQPSYLGFATLIGGLVLAAMNKENISAAANPKI